MAMVMVMTLSAITRLMVNDLNRADIIAEKDETGFWLGPRVNTTLTTLTTRTCQMMFGYGEPFIETVNVIFDLVSRLLIYV